MAYVVKELPRAYVRQRLRHRRRPLSAADETSDFSALPISFPRAAAEESEKM
jgi:hypothetical protein